MRKLRRQYKVKNMPEKRLPAIVDKAVWEKITKGRAGIRWNIVVEKIWKDLGVDQEEVLTIDKFGGYKTESKGKIEERERLALINKVKEETHLEIFGGLREDIVTKTHLHDPMDYAKKIKLRLFVGDLDLPERRKRYTSSRAEKDVATNMCPCGTTIESRTHIVGECEIRKEVRDALEKKMRKLDV